LLVQHARIEELFTLAAGTDGDAKRAAFDDLVRMLAVHETAEEEVVHPLSRGLVDGGDAMVDAVSPRSGRPRKSLWRWSRPARTARASTTRCCCCATRC
jgi:Hemerythrin HHE cation binding domain